MAASKRWYLKCSNIFLVLFGVGGEPYLKGAFLDDDRSNRWFSRPRRTNPLQEVIVLYR